MNIPIAITTVLFLLFSGAPFALATQYIDTHMHLLVQKGGDRGTQGATPGRGAQLAARNSRQGAADEYRVAASTLVSQMNEAGVGKAIVMPPPQQMDQSGRYDYRVFQKAIDLFPGRLFFAAGGGTLNAIIHSVPPDAVTPEVRARFERTAGELAGSGAVAFGEITAMHLCMHQGHHYIAQSPDHPLFKVLADLSAKFNLPIDFHMEAVPNGGARTPANLLQACSKNPTTLPSTLPAFERLVQHNRSAKIVWQHVGWDNLGWMTPDLISGMLGRHPNLYIALRVEERRVQIGTNTPMPNRLVDANGQWREDWLSVMRAFPDRFMIGSDEFIRGSAMARQMPRSFLGTWALVRQLPPELAQAVGQDNASRIYPLGNR